jgi:hypothetical protein
MICKVTNLIGIIVFFWGSLHVCRAALETRPKRSYWSTLWSGPRINREARKNIKLLFLLGVVGLETSSEIFVRLPQQLVYGSAPIYAPERKPDQDSVVIIFPGAGGPDENTDSLRNKIKNEDAKSGISRDVEVYDWLKWRGNFLRAAFDSQAVGRKVCTELTNTEGKYGKIKELHVIGVSVGAFAADSCTKTYKSLSQDPGNTRLTLLDPFTSKGVFGYGWGVSNFGKAADIAEVYLNRDDPVPTTNEPLQNAYNFDVTKSKARSAFQPATGDSMHSWPVVYLAQTWISEVDLATHLPKLPSKDSEPRGQVISVP